MRHVQHRTSATTDGGRTAATPSGRSGGRLVAGVAIAALIGLGCGDSDADDSTAATDEPSESSPVVTEDTGTTPATAPPDTDASTGDDDLARIIPDLGIDGAIMVGEIGVLMGEVDGVERRIVDLVGGNGLVVYGVAPAPGEVDAAGTAIESTGLLASLQIELSDPPTAAQVAAYTYAADQLGLGLDVLDPLLVGESNRVEADGVAVCLDDRPSLLFVPDAFPCG